MNKNTENRHNKKIAILLEIKTDVKLFQERESSHSILWTTRREGSKWRQPTYVDRWNSFPFYSVFFIFKIVKKNVGYHGAVNATRDVKRVQFGLDFIVDQIEFNKNKWSCI